MIPFISFHFISFHFISFHMSYYEIALCQRFNETVHGFDIQTSSPEIYHHYLCLFPFDFMDPEQFSTARSLGEYCRGTIEIIFPVMLSPGNEMVAIYKTFWLRIFQRKCRKWILNRKYARSSRLFKDLIRREYASR